MLRTARARPSFHRSYRHTAQSERAQRNTDAEATIHNLNLRSRTASAQPSPRAAAGPPGAGTPGPRSPGSCSARARSTAPAQRGSSISDHYVFPLQAQQNLDWVSKWYALKREPSDSREDLSPAIPKMTALKSIVFCETLLYFSNEMASDFGVLLQCVFLYCAVVQKSINQY